MRLVLKSKQLDEREVAGSALADQAHVSPYPIQQTLNNITINPIRMTNVNRKHTKPKGLYTSSAVKIDQMLQSDWYGFMNSEQFGHAECIVLLKVDPSARIQEVKTREEYLELVDKYGINPLGGLWGSKSLNFDAIAKEFDGFRITRKGLYAVAGLSDGWDVEQTVWFNNKVLTPIPVKPESEIKAQRGFPEYVKEKYDYLALFDKGYPDYEGKNDD